MDGIYMTVCQIMTGSGGWPLTILMTPERKPFFAGTYIPKENRHGRVGMIELIQGVQRVWQTRQGDVLSSAEQVTTALQQASATLGRLVVDASGMPCLDSLGIECLLDVGDELSQGGRALKLCATTETVRHVLDLTGLADSFEFFDDVNTGVRSFL